MSCVSPEKVVCEGKPQVVLVQELHSTARYGAAAIEYVISPSSLAY